MHTILRHKDMGLKQRILSEILMVHPDCRMCSTEFIIWVALATNSGNRKVFALQGPENTALLLRQN